MYGVDNIYKYGKNHLRHNNFLINFLSILSDLKLARVHRHSNLKK